MTLPVPVRELPALSNLSKESHSLRPRQPANFSPAGTVEWTQRLSAAPPFIEAQRKARRTGRRAQGIRYEKQGHEHLTAIYGARYIPSPWFEFLPRGANRPRICQPDALILDRAAKTLTIVEFKYQHTFDAWYQLFALYLPVVSKWSVCDGFSISCVEIVKWFDPTTHCEPRPLLCASVDLAVRGEFNVHIWKK